MTSLSNSKSSISTECSKCSKNINNSPICDSCIVCGNAICTSCGTYTSDFDIYCEAHDNSLKNGAKKIGDYHYYNTKLKKDFFVGNKCT